MFKYFEGRKGKNGAQTALADPPQSPILNDDDERFLEKLTGEDQAPPLPARPVVVFDGGEKKVGKDAQEALMDGAEQIALPNSPPAEGDTPAKSTTAGKASAMAHDYLSYVRNIPQRLGSSKVGPLSPSPYSSSG